MLYATNRFPGDGTTTQYEISFLGGYLDRAHVKAYVESPDLVRTTVTINPANFLGPNTIKGFPVVPPGSTLVIYRDTPKKPIVDFVNGSRFTEANLDTATRQGTFIAAEGADAGQVTSAIAQAAIAAQQAAIATEAAQDAQASAGEIGAAVLSYDTYAVAQSAAGGLPSASIVEVSQDETRAGARTRYKVQAGALVFVVNLDQWRAYLDQLRVDLAAPTGSTLIGTKMLGSGAVSRTLQDKLGDIPRGADYGILSDWTDETAAVQAMVDATPPSVPLQIPSNTRHTVPLASRLQVGVHNKYAININPTIFNATSQANKQAKNTDKNIYMFGDSHGWGQGGPEWDSYLGTGASTHSASLFNKGFFERIAEHIRTKSGFDEKVYMTAGTAGRRVFSTDCTQPDSVDPINNPLKIGTGRVVTEHVPYTFPFSSYLGWFTPAANTDPRPDVASLRDKFVKGRFGESVLRLSQETINTFSDVGKNEFVSLHPFQSGPAEDTFTGVSVGGGILAQYKAGEFYLTVNEGAHFADMGFFTTYGYYFIHGYGKFYASALAGHTIRVWASDGTSYPTGLEKYLYPGLRIYKDEAISSTFVYADPAQAFRKAYIAVKVGPAGMRLRVSMPATPGGVDRLPFSRMDAYTATNTPRWNYGRTDFPRVYVVSEAGPLIGTTVDRASVNADSVVLNTYSDSLADVVVCIDYGSKTRGRLVIQLDGADPASLGYYADVRGVLFDNNQVTNFSLGGHTIGQWMGYSASYSDVAIDHLARISTYSKCNPHLAIVQLPLVNEYLRQTEISAFKEHISNLIYRVNGIQNGLPTDRYTDFLFFTTIGTQAQEFLGATSSAITYDMYVAAAKEQCIASGVGFVDCRAMLRDMVSSGLISQDRLFSDDAHPSSAANELISQKIISIIDEIL